MMMDLSSIGVATLKGVGPKLNALLLQLEIFSVQDLLFHLPRQYEDRTRITKIDQLQTGSKALIEGAIVKGQIQFGKRRTLVCRIEDSTGEMTLTFFHFTNQQSEALTTSGLTIRCFGEVREDYRRRRVMVHPEYRTENHSEDLSVDDCLTPIYSTTQGLNQKTWHKLIKQAIDLMQQSANVSELLPQQVLNDFSNIPLIEAIGYLHQPPKDADLDLLLQGKHKTQQRLAFEELIAHQLGLAKFRLQCRERKAPNLSGEKKFQQKLLINLPFMLTHAQQRVLSEINQDLSKSAPMMRLVQGDVGSGKTIIAALAMLQAVEHGYQAALMAPTELLAEQHYKTITTWFEPLGICVGWLSGSLIGKPRRLMFEKIVKKEVDVIIGTHALFQDEVKFSNLALLIVDEQHRFGVHQRLALKEKGLSPHQLIMTATPIPRTLAMSVYADLDVSIIDELPPGRKPIQTVLLSNQKRDEVIERVRVNCQKGRQAYWVCTIIDDSEVLPAKAAEKLCRSLSQSLSDLNVAIVHGRMKAVDKEAVMAAFKSGKIDLLVATTVIEVGVDVPNASLMIIENAERLGLAQLHQLRGRVGRSEQASFCVLLYQKPVSQTAEKRLKVMRDHQDGFFIAEKDLEIRGPGEVLGTRQTGLVRLKVADLMRDQVLLPKVKAASRFLVKEKPDLIEPLLDRWLKGCQRYAQV